MLRLTFTEMKFVVKSHLDYLPRKFIVGIKDRQHKLPSMYWLPKNYMESPGSATIK